MSNWTRYWVLVEPSMGETVAKPGALFREVHTETSFEIDILIGPHEWVPRFELFGYTVGDSGAETISAAVAAKLEAGFPWPGARTIQRQ